MVFQNYNNTSYQVHMLLVDQEIGDFVLVDQEYWDVFLVDRGTGTWS